MIFTLKPDLTKNVKRQITWAIQKYLDDRFIEADECIWWVVDPGQAGFTVYFRVISEMGVHIGEGFYSYEKKKFWIDIFD